MVWIVWVMFFITVIALSGIGLGYIDGRRKYKLDLQKEERRLIEARTKAIEAENQRAELEYRRAQQELDRFDRESAALPPPSRLADPADPR